MRRRLQVEGQRIQFPIGKGTSSDFQNTIQKTNATKNTQKTNGW